MDIEKFIKMINISNNMSKYIRLCNIGNDVNQFIRYIELTRYNNEEKETFDNVKKYVSERYNINVSNSDNYDELVNILLMYRDKCYNEAWKIPVDSLERELKEKILRDSFGIR